MANVARGALGQCYVVAGVIAPGEIINEAWAGLAWSRERCTISDRSRLLTAKVPKAG